MGAEAVRDANHIHDENEQEGKSSIGWNRSDFRRDSRRIDCGNSWQIWLQLLRNRFPGRSALVLLTPSTSTSCPTATATLMPASTISPMSVRNPLSRGLRSLVSSCRGPTWLWLRQKRRVAVPTRPVLLRLLPGTVLRLSWLHATAPTAPLKESWPLLVSFLWLKRLSACSQ